MDGIEEFLRQIADDREAYTTRIDAIDAVRASREPAVLAALVKAMQSTDAHVRRKAAEVLAEYHDDIGRARPPLAARPPVDTPGSAACDRLAFHTRALDALIAAVKDPDEGVRRNVVRALATFSDERAADLIRKAASDPSPSVQRAVQEALKSQPRFSAPPRQEPPTPRPAPVAHEERKAPEPPQSRKPVAPPPPKAEAPPPHEPAAAAPRPVPPPPAPPPPEPVGSSGAPRATLQTPAEAGYHKPEFLYRSWRAAFSWPAIELGAAGVLLIYLAIAGFTLGLGASKLQSALFPAHVGTLSSNDLLRLVLGYVLAVGLVWLALSFIGLAITRLILQRIGSGEAISLRTACGFALKRWLRVFVLPLPVLLMLAALVAAKALLMRAGPAGDLGALIQPAAYLAHLLLSVAIVFLVFLLAAGGSAWLPCVAAEDATVRSALSASLLHIVRAPWMCLMYNVATLLRAAAACAVIGAVLFLASPTLTTDPSSLLTMERLRAAWNEPISAQFFCDIVIGIAQAGVFFLGAGYVLALLFAGGSGTYLAVRARVSGAPTRGMHKK